MFPLRIAIEVEKKSLMDDDKRSKEELEKAIYPFYRGAKNSRYVNFNT